MIPNGSNITLETSDGYFLAWNGSNFILTQEPSTDDVSVWTVNYCESLGFRLSFYSNDGIFFLNCDSDHGWLTAVTDSTFTGTHWCSSPAVNQNNAGPSNKILLIGLTQNGASRFLSGSGKSNTVSTIQFPPLEHVRSNSAVWTYSIQAS